MASTSTTLEPTESQKLANSIRFETELEFVQCLANPFYLQSLAQQDLFSDETFLNYLKYLKYWQEPKFARFIQYPQALHHLILLQHPSFREALKNQTIASELAGKQLAHWASWRERSSLFTNSVDGVGGMNGNVNGVNEGGGGGGGINGANGNNGMSNGMDIDAVNGVAS